MKTTVKIEKEMLEQIRKLRPELADLKDAQVIRVILREALTASRSPPLKRKEREE